MKFRLTYKKGEKVVFQMPDSSLDDITDAIHQFRSFIESIKIIPPPPPSKESIKTPVLKRKKMGRPIIDRTKYVPDIIKWYKEGNTSRKIKDLIKEKHGIRISPKTILDWIKEEGIGIRRGKRSRTIKTIRLANSCEKCKGNSFIKAGNGNQKYMCKYCGNVQIDPASEIQRVVVKEDDKTKKAVFRDLDDGKDFDEIIHEHGLDDKLFKRYKNEWNRIQRAKKSLKKSIGFKDKIIEDEEGTRIEIEEDEYEEDDDEIYGQP